MKACIKSVLLFVHVIGLANCRMHLVEVEDFLAETGAEHDPKISKIESVSTIAKNVEEKNNKKVKEIFKGI